MGMTAEQFKAIKARADKEWKRRVYNGSMSSYADKTLSSVAAGSVMTAADGNTVMTPFAEKMVTHGNLATSSNGTIIQSSFDNNTISGWLTTLESRTATASANDCNAACSGLCVTACSTGCTGCTSCTGCTGTCSGTCTGCEGTCTGTCTGCSSCSGTCTGTCQGCSSCSGCTGGCFSCSGCTSCASCAGYRTCGSSCTSCTGGCTSCSNCAGANCSGSCQGNCNGCSGGCTGSCRGTSRR